MELECNASAEPTDHDITDAQRWTPERHVAVARAYRALLRQWHKRPWSTTQLGHVCSDRCYQVTVRNVVLCAQSGAVHVCGDVCDRTVVTHEARVCTLTARIFPRDMCADVYDAPGRPGVGTAAAASSSASCLATAKRHQGPQRPSAASSAPAVLQAALQEVTQLLPDGTPSAERLSVGRIVALTWGLVQTSDQWPQLKSGYPLPHHTLVVLRLLVQGMRRPDGLLVVPRSEYVATHAPSLRRMTTDETRLRAHTRAAKAFRRLLHGVPEEAFRHHAQRLEAPEPTRAATK